MYFFFQELYNFKQQNPQADLEPFLAKSSQYFRDYIERGLKNIERDTLSGVGAASSAASAVLTDQMENGQQATAAAAAAPSASTGAQSSQYLARLRRLREQAGLDEGSKKQAVGYKIATTR